ncbi:MAG TPA: hypothetical protein VKK81_05950 [Candidatus Binatia bacterium]|nr:hypothetical protein [Candidatus Binatia bacterium]
MSTTNERQLTDDEYQLAIDTQGEAFLQLRQKLTYFIVTASIVVISFALNFYIKNVHNSKLLHQLHGNVLAAAAICALAASGLALASLHFGHLSFRKHLEARYARKTFENHTPREQFRWNFVNKAASIALLLSFACLFAEILILLIFFWPIF